MSIEFISRLFNLLGIVALVYGFCGDCVFLYYGTILVIIAEIMLYSCLYRMDSEALQKVKQSHD